jgi:site-specific DNA-methyltransferase (adenine-specific)
MENKFILGDCMDKETGLPSYPDNYFDLAIVDPPYGIGEDGGKQRTRGSKKTNGSKKNWDSKPPEVEYFKELFRVSKNQIIWGANHFISKIPFNSSCWLIWDKLDYGSDFADFEMAWTSFNSAAKSYRQTRQSNQNHITRPRIHPTQKPYCAI